MFAGTYTCKLVDNIVIDAGNGANMWTWHKCLTDDLCRVHRLISRLN